MQCRLTGVLWVAAVAMLIGTLLPVMRMPTMPHWAFAGLDLQMRLNEAECVIAGTDPYLVWSGRRPAGKYIPWDWRHLKSEAVRDRLIHAYPPWSYGYAMPLALLPRRIAVTCYSVLQILVLLGVFAYAFRLGYSTVGRSALAGLAFLVAALSMSGNVCSCLIVMNYGILIAGAVLLAVVSHRKGHDCLAGVFWALAMVKPQIGLLCVIPLLIRRKWRTLAVVGAVLAVGTLVPAAFCGRSPISLCMSMSDYSAGQFGWTGLWGRRLLAWFPHSGWATGLKALNAVVGIGLCTLCSLFLRHERDSLIWAMPMLFLSTLWTTSRDHDFSVWMIACLSAAYVASVSKMRMRGYVATALLLCIVAGSIWPNGNDYVCWSSLGVCLTLPVVCQEVRSAERRML